MKLKTERHTTETLWVQVPKSLNGMHGVLTNTLAFYLDAWDRVHLPDGITISRDSIETALDWEDRKPLDPVSPKILGFLKALAAIEPIPDEYFIHL